MDVKKNFWLNCDVCDARNVQEHRFDGYEKIRINADVLLLNERSKAILDAYPLNLNVDTTLMVDEDVDFQQQNGKMTIGKGDALVRPTILIVNGALEIEPETEEVLQKYVAIVVNGAVTYPKNLAPYLTKMTVNGAVSVYPSDCVRLKNTVAIDKYFGMRAKAKSRYYAEKKVLFLDEELDVASLLEKGVSFETKKLIVSERLVEAVLPMFDEAVELQVVKAGCVYVPGDTVLDEALLRKSGDILYVDGNLCLEEGSTPLLSRIKKLYVNGSVELMEPQKNAFLEVDAEYKNLQIRKGERISGKLEVMVDEALLALHPDGVCLQNCVSVTLDETLTPEQIQKQLRFEKCVEIKCSDAQRSAVAAVSENVAGITTGENEEKTEILDAIESMINADTYIL